MTAHDRQDPHRRPLAGMNIVAGVGPTGRQVADNVRRLREGQNLTFAELSRRTADAGREVPTIGLRRIEANARRVDVDDLTVLAQVLGVPPADLLQPLPPFIVQVVTTEGDA